MKNMMIGLGMAFLTGLILLALLILSSRQQREKELEHALTFSVCESLRSVERSGRTVSSESMEKEVKERLKKRMKEEERGEKDQSFSLKVKVLEADSDKGILSCRAEESYRHMNGQRGKVTAEATAILEADAKDSFYQVDFYLPGQKAAFRSYLLQEDSKLIRPKDPSMEGKAFEGWYEASGEKLKEDRRVSENMDFWARFRPSL